MDDDDRPTHPDDGALDPRPDDNAGRDDTEGHWRVGRRADGEGDETEDVEGHRRRFHTADAERDEAEAEDEDTEGHWRVGRRADGERDETDDVGGHGA